MAEWKTVAEARALHGLRLVITRGVPGPWGEAAKGVLAAKKLSYVLVQQEGGLENDELRSWTGQANAPQLVHDGEPARSGWHEILELAERLAPEPALVPTDEEQRVRMLGMSAELCGAGGFGWQRRLMLLEAMYLLPEVPEIARRLGSRYGYTPAAAAHAKEHCAAILDHFSKVWREQRERGSDYLVGDRLSAVDIHWAAFAAMVEPLPHELCPMAEPMRAGYTIHDPELRERCDPGLLGHRDRIYRETIGLPIEL